MLLFRLSSHLLNNIFVKNTLEYFVTIFAYPFGAKIPPKPITFSFFFPWVSPARLRWSGGPGVINIELLRSSYSLTANISNNTLDLRLPDLVSWARGYYLSVYKCSEKQFTTQSSTHTLPNLSLPKHSFLTVCRCMRVCRRS